MLSLHRAGESLRYDPAQRDYIGLLSEASVMASRVWKARGSKSARVRLHMQPDSVVR